MTELPTPDEQSQLRSWDANRPPWREETLHVLGDKCRTCVFRPGNPMQLRPGRLAAMVAYNQAHSSFVACHSTLYRDDVDQAVCRGYYDAYADQSLPLAFAAGLDLVEFDPVPEDNLAVLEAMMRTEQARAGGAR